MILLLCCICLLGDATIFESEEERDFEVIIDDIENLIKNPIEINTARLEDLVKIPYLSPVQCLKIIEHRPFSKIDELLSIPGIDRDVFEKIKPLVTVGPKAFSFEKLTTRMRVMTQIPHEQSSERYYTKSQCIFSNYNIFLVTEKDPYESSFVDYYSAGIIINDRKWKFAFGKYNLDLGTGVVLSPIGSFFTTTDFRVMMNERGILPYTSSLENSGFFGAAFSDSFFVKYTVFYSNQKVDGRIDSLGFARSFYESGNHTDSSSLSRKDRINEEILGYDLRYRFSNLLISNRSYRCVYSPAFVCDDSFAQFYGNKFWISAVGLNYYGDQFVVFSEWARSFNNRIGGLFGFSGFFPYFDFNLAGKYFPLGFYSPKGVEADDNYFGGTLDISHHSKLINLGTTVTFDNKVETDSAKYGLRVNLEKNYGIINAKFQIRWRFTKEMMDLSGARVFLRITPIKIIFFDLRLEEKHVYDSNELDRGIFGAIEAGLQLKNLQFRVRYGLFNTDSYASRIYVYEIDLLGIINNRMLYNSGHYGFIFLSIKPIERITTTFKYSLMHRDSDTTTQIGCQIDVRL
ncbi:MAG: helix-hairpin-helix domain-containing protein [bacterium]